MVLFTIFIVGLSFIFSRALGGGWDVVGLAFIFSGLMSLGSYYYGDQLILSMSQARPANRQTDFNFFTVAENLAMADQLPVPKLYVIEDSAPNAFATGRDPNHAVVVATTGLLQKLDRSELEGVIAHELSHIKHYDTRLMSVVVILIGMVTLLADWFMRLSFFGGRKNSRDEKENLGMIISVVAIILALLSPLFARLIQLAISRRREFYADAGSALLTRYPDGLIRALKKISADPDPLEAANKATSSLYIINPLKDTHGSLNWFANLFNTHPSVEERIKALQGIK